MLGRMMRRAASAVVVLAAMAGSALAATTDGDISTNAVAAIRAEIVRNPTAALKVATELRVRVTKRQPSPQRSVALATADWLRAGALSRINQPAEAIVVVNNALRELGSPNVATQLQGELLLVHGTASAAVGNIQTALADYQRAYRIMQAVNEPRGQALALQDIGIIYRDAGDFESALKYNTQSVETYSRDPALLLSAYNNRGNALTELGRAAEAAKEYGLALTAVRQMNSPLLETRILQNLARSQADAKDYDDAESTLRRAYGLATSGPAATWRPALDGVAALVALRRHQLDSAARLIERTFDGAEAVAATMPLRDFHRTAYDIFRARGEDGKALAHLEAFKKLDDEKRVLAASTNAALMSARFDFANQDLKIARLNAGQVERDRAIERAGARQRATVLVSLLTASAIIVTLLLIGFFSIRRSRNQVRAANQTLSATNTKLEKALAAKTEFLATTSHEIRTPLNGILGMTQVILADRALPTPVRDRVALVQGAGETMKALVDDLLDVAKMETGEIIVHPEPTHLIRLLEDAARVWSDQASTKGLSLEVDLGGAPDAIMADEVRLRQIVFNLMANAIKFTDQGGVRLIATVDAAGDEERLLIRVEDSGIGIPADALEAIFESFRQIDGGTTRRHGGTGLGLTICRNLARAMGGEVRVASTPGAGSAFTLDLPLERVALPDAGGAERVVTHLGEADLLLVEANPLSQGIMRAVLGGAVSGLHIVSDGDAALTALDAGGIDHVMADGVTLGLDPQAVVPLAAAANAHGARLSVLWPAPDESVRQALAAVGAHHVLAKPIGAPDLLAALQKVYAGDMAGRDIAA